MFPSQFLSTMNHLKTLSMVSMQTEFVAENSILDRLSEKLNSTRLRKGNNFFPLVHLAMLAISFFVLFLVLKFSAQLQLKKKN